MTKPRGTGLIRSRSSTNHVLSLCGFYSQFHKNKQRDVGTGDGGRRHSCHLDFERSVKTRVEGRLFSPHYYSPPGFSDLPPALNTCLPYATKKITWGKQRPQVFSNFGAVDSWKIVKQILMQKIKYDSIEYRWLFSTTLFFEINILSHSSHLNIQPFQRHETRTNIYRKY